jgi:hypothetical protein
MTTHEPIPGCDPWPKNLAPLQSCCVIPAGRDNAIERQCLADNCAKYNHSGNSTSREMAAICYLTKTKILVETKLDKEAIKTMYLEKSELYKNHTENKKNPWIGVIGDALTKCEKIPVTMNKTIFIDKLYECIDGFLRTHCVIEAIESTDECEAVLAHFEECKKIKPTCGEWPLNVMIPELCCNAPEMLNEETKTACNSKCSTKTKNTEKYVCIHDCIVNKLNLKHDGKVDFAVVKTLLIKNSDKKVKWDESIEKAVEACKTVIAGENVLKG